MDADTDLRVLTQILSKWDLLSGHAKQGHIQHILIDQLEIQQRSNHMTLLKAKLVFNGLPHSEETLIDISEFRGVEHSDTMVLVVFPYNLSDTLLSTSKMIVTDMQCTEIQGQYSFSATPSTIVYPWHAHHMQSIVCFEVCCGGFGGWTQAIYGISDAKMNILGGIDSDIDCIKCYAIAHEAVILPGNTHFTKQEYLQKGGSVNKPLAIHARVQDDNWKQGVVECGFNCLCMSCPCQPFAETGSKGGLFHENGMVTLHTMGFARFARPPWIIIEQVPGFQKHLHFSLFRRSLRFFGYEIQHSHTVPFELYGPPQRKRDIIILKRFDIPSKDFSVFCKLQPRSRIKPSQLYPEPIVPEDMLNDCLLDVITLGWYLDTTYGPFPHNTSWNLDKLKAYRSLDHDQCPGTFMAQYGSQHLLSDIALKKSGILGQLKITKDGLRFFAPLEIALFHLPMSNFVLPKDTRKAWRILGNLITPIHAAYGLLWVLHNICQTTGWSMNTCLQTLVTRRIDSSNMQIAQGNYGYEISKSHLPDSVLGCIEHGISLALEGSQLTAPVCRHEISTWAVPQCIRTPSNTLGTVWLSKNIEVRKFASLWRCSVNHTADVSMHSEPGIDFAFQSSDIEPLNTSIIVFYAFDKVFATECSNSRDVNFFLSILTQEPPTTAWLSIHRSGVDLQGPFLTIQERIIGKYRFDGFMDMIKLVDFEAMIDSVNHSWTLRSKGPLLDLAHFRQWNCMLLQDEFLVFHGLQRIIHRIDNNHLDIVISPTGGRLAIPIEIFQKFVRLNFLGHLLLNSGMLSITGVRMIIIGDSVVLWSGAIAGQTLVEHIGLHILLASRLAGTDHSSQISISDISYPINVAELTHRTEISLETDQHRYILRLQGGGFPKRRSCPQHPWILGLEHLDTRTDLQSVILQGSAAVLHQFHDLLLATYYGSFFPRPCPSIQWQYIGRDVIILQKGSLSIVKMILRQTAEYFHNGLNVGHHTVIAINGEVVVTSWTSLTLRDWEHFLDFLMYAFQQYPCRTTVGNYSISAYTVEDCEYETHAEELPVIDIAQHQYRVTIGSSYRGTLRVVPPIIPSQITSLWRGTFSISSSELDLIPPSLNRTYNIGMSLTSLDESAHNCLIMTYHDGNCWIFRPWRNRIQKALEHYHKFVHGHPSPGQLVGHLQLSPGRHSQGRCFTTTPLTVVAFDLDQLVGFIPGMTLDVTISATDDIKVMVFAHELAIEFMAQLFHWLISPTWLHAHGWQVQYELQQINILVVKYEASGDTLAMPSQHVQRYFQHHLLRCLFHTLRIHDGGFHIRVYHLSDLVWAGQITGEITGSMLNRWTTLLFRMIGTSHPYQWCFQGKPLQDAYLEHIISFHEINTLQWEPLILRGGGTASAIHFYYRTDALRLLIADTRFLIRLAHSRIFLQVNRILYLSKDVLIFTAKTYAKAPLRLQGGGAKEEHIKEVKHLLATLLMEKHQPWDSIQKTVEMILKKAGHQRLDKVVKKPTLEMQWQNLQSLCQDIDFTLPEPDAQLVAKAFKSRSRQKQQNIEARMNPSASNYKLEEGFFVDKDLQALPSLQSLGPRKRGVILLNLEDAQTWLSSTSPISPDELGIVILGREKPQSPLKMDFIHVPVRDQMGQRALVAAWIVQMGQKQVMRGTWNQDIQEQDMTIVALTLWKDEFPTDTWQLILQNPIRNMLGIFYREGFQPQFASIWGRSWRAQSGAVEPGQANSFQCHVKMRKDDMVALLPRSGFTSIYMTPKEDGKISNEYMVIWLKLNKHQIEVQSAQLAYTYGLVRTFKTMGIRVSKAYYTTAFQLLRPNDKEPVIVENNFRYRLDGGPTGLTQDTLQVWLSACQWKARPLRALGATSWLISAETECPSGHLSINGQTVLLRLQPNSRRDQVTVVAGPTPKTKPTTDTHMVPLVKDPWGGYTPTTISHAPSEGPIASQIDQQEQRLVKLETSLEKLSQAQEAQGQQTAHQIDQLAQEQQKVLSRVDERLHSVTSELQRGLAETLEQTMKAQESRTQTAFDELKQLICRGIKRPGEGTGMQE